MLLCRVLSVFLLLYTLACETIAAKNISQDTIGVETKKFVKLDILKVKEQSKSEVLDYTDYSLESSGDQFEESNVTFSNDSIFDDDKYGYVIEKFINDMELFWQDVKSFLAEQNNKSITAGDWWHGETEHRYNLMKERFYQSIPKDLPQKVQDVIREYEMRYNDLMWSEIESMITKKPNKGEENMSAEAAPSCAADANLNDKTEERSNEDFEDSISDDKCKKRSFEDIFHVKITKARSFSAINYDE